MALLNNVNILYGLRFQPHGFSIQCEVQFQFFESLDMKILHFEHANLIPAFIYRVGVIP